MNYRSILIVCLATLGLAVAGWGQADGKIAFLSDRDGHKDVWIMNADGSDPVNLTQGRHCASPAWSPDGTKIAYIYLDDYPRGRYGGEIWLMDADGGNPQQLTDDSSDKISLSWSTNGRSIYYDVLGEPTHGGNFIVSFVMALDGSGSSEVYHSDVPHFRYYSRSPDGIKEAVVVLRQEGDEENLAHLYITGEDESSVIPLPDLHQSGLCVVAGIQGAGCRHGSGLCEFSPAGPSPIRPDFPEGTVCVSDNTWTFNPTWSPNSMRIAFPSLTRLIWAVDIDGSNLVELTNGLGGDSPAWQPVVSSATSVESQSWGRIKSLLSH